MNDNAALERNRGSRLPRSLTIPSLNGIRAISVLIVILSHSGFGTIVPGGLGVTIFFFLSGYLITTLLMVELGTQSKIDIPQFYLRRAYRLLPPLIVTLIVAYGLVFAHVISCQFSFFALASQLFYFANYYGLFFDPGSTTTPPGTGILWSLAVEEHFYIFFPLLLILLLRDPARPRALAAVLIALCLAVLIWRIYLVHSGASEDRTYYSSDTRMDSIAYGCLLALVANPMVGTPSRDQMSWRQWLVLILGLGALIVTLLARNPAFRETFRYSIQGIALLPIFYFAIKFSKNSLFRHLNTPWIVKLGVYSYFIYLIHFVIIRVLVTYTGGPLINPFVVFAVALALSVGYAAMIDRFVDPYFRELRRRAHGASIEARGASNRIRRSPEMVNRDEVGAQGNIAT
jgi:peptidoglycan/LPS O-acetylase OafA/YrhL